MTPIPEAPSPGDLVWVQSGPTKGTEQSGRRPALVVAGAAYNRLSGRALILPISTRVREWLTEVALPSGLAITGVVLTDQARMIDWRARELTFAGRVDVVTLEWARDGVDALMERS